MTREAVSFEEVFLGKISFTEMVHESVKKKQFNCNLM